MKNMKCLSFSVLIDFSLKSILLDIRIVTPACFLGTFDWNYFFLSPLLCGNVCEVRYVFIEQQQDKICLHIQFISLCLFIGDLRPFRLMDINDQ